MRLARFHTPIVPCIDYCHMLQPTKFGHFFTQEKKRKRKEKKKKNPSIDQINLHCRLVAVPVLIVFMVVNFILFYFLFF